MQVHIVCDIQEREHILARLATALQRRTGFSLAPIPSDNAQVNYFFPYLFHTPISTHTAAWFTHRDDSIAGKAGMWEQAAQRVNLRLTSARQYQKSLAPFGETRLVTPYIERDRFVPSGRPKDERNHIPVVGVAGYVYSGGRKGEHLVKQLAESVLGRKIYLNACGRGWPVHTINITWENVPRWFQTLDIYLCTSLVEGIPAPPLEALSCGIPVVIPRGVGLLDDLPQVPGVWRYTAGDYKSMVKALEQATQRFYDSDPEQLRALTERYSLYNWTEDHVAAFEALLEPPPEPNAALPDWRTCSAVYYVAYGDQARNCAEKSIASFKYHMPSVPVYLASDVPLGLEDVFIEYPDEDIGARSAKTAIYDNVGEDKQYILYVDADTEFVAPVEFLFQALQDGWEFLICYNPAQYHLASHMRRPDNQDECDETFSLLGSDELLQYNGGVFAFRRNDRTARLMRGWHKEWQRYGKRDQAALDRVLYTEPVKVYTLGSEWNTVTRYIDAARTAGILHYPMTARRWKGVIKGRSDSPEAWGSLHPGGREEN